MSELDVDIDGALDPVTIGLVSISDRASSGVYQDKGLPALKAWLGPRIRETHLVPGAGHMMGLKHWREIMARSAAPPPA